jgi:transposase-like protein
MDKEIQQRLQWVKLYEQSRDAGFVCRRCGISRPTLRKWWRRYQLNGVEGLSSQSRKPLSSPTTKVNPQYEQLILTLRGQRNLGARRIQSELLRQHELALGLATIHKVLQKNHVKPVKKLRKKASYIRYSRPLPGDRVQMGYL